MKDLILLVADKNMQYALRGALQRPEALGIREIQFDFIVHPGRDGGARKSGAALLALKRHQFSHAALLFDLEGCGAARSEPLLIEAPLDAELAKIWGANAKAIVIDPKLDAWMWGSDHAVEQAIDWNRPGRIRAWLAKNGFTFGPKEKPVRPKEALESALREVSQPRSSALYQKIASKISLQNCADPAFHRLRSALSDWFPPDPPGATSPA